MPEWISQKGLSALLRNVLIGYVLFYTIDSVMTAFVSVMIGSNWSDLSRTEKCIRVALILKAWASSMLALITNSAKRIQGNEFPVPGDVETTTKTTVAMASTSVTKEA